MKEKKRFRIVSKLLSQLLNIDEDLRVIYLIFSMLMRCDFFKTYNIKFLYDIYSKILTKSQLTQTIDNNSNAENISSYNTDCLTSSCKVTLNEKNTGIIKLFSLIPKVSSVLITVNICYSKIFF